MRICIPTEDDRGLESRAFDHFGGAPYFTIVDAESGALEVVRNPKSHDQHGSCHHVQVLQAQSVDTVACQGMGRRAVAGLRDAGIQVLVPGPMTVSGIVEAVKTGQARQLAEGDACGGGRRGHGHGYGCGHGHGAGHRHGCGDAAG